MIRRVALVILMSLFAASTLSACGKKGPLELPDGRTANPGQPKKDEDPAGFKN
jgi:predicted small lipoprotein YifL